jgi:hypothetical protein
MLRKSHLASFVAFAMLTVNALAQLIVLTPSTTNLSGSGGTVTFTASISYTGTPSVLAFTATLPDGFSYVSGTNEPTVHPSTGTTGELGWAYTSTVPANSTTFTFTATYSSGLNGLQPLTSSVVTRDSSETPPVTTSGPSIFLSAPPLAFVWNGDSTTHKGLWTDVSMWSPAGTVPDNNGLSTYSAELSQGTATISTGGTITLNDLFVFGGSINGGGVLNLLGENSRWTHGEITGLSTLNIAPSAIFTVSTYAQHNFDQTNIINQGTFNWTDGGALRSGNGGLFINAPGAVFNDRSSGTTTDYLITNPFGGSFDFTNAGTYVKVTAGSTTRIEVPFINTGNLIINGGTLRFTSTFFQAGGNISLAAGTSLVFDHTVSLVGGTLIGNGTVVGNVINGYNPSNTTTTPGVNASSIIETAFISPGNTLGQLNIQGGLALLETSKLLFDLGGTSQGTTYDFLSISGPASLGGLLTVGFQNNFGSTVNSSMSFTVLTAGSLVGTFAGLTDGARVFTTDGLGSFVVNYSSTSVTLSNYQLVPVPEPSTWALMISGLGVIAFRAYRRRQQG